MYVMTECRRIATVNIVTTILYYYILSTREFLDSKYLLSLYVIYIDFIIKYLSWKYVHTCIILLCRLIQLFLNTFFWFCILNWFAFDYSWQYIMIEDLLLSNINNSLIILIHSYRKNKWDNVIINKIEVPLVMSLLTLR